MTIAREAFCCLFGAPEDVPASVVIQFVALADRQNDDSLRVIPAIGEESVCQDLCDQLMMCILFDTDQSFSAQIRFILHGERPAGSSHYYCQID